MEKGSMDDSIATAIAVIETQISALSGVSVKLIADNLQKWTIAYKEDKGPCYSIYEAMPGTEI